MAGDLKAVGEVFPFTYGKNLPSESRNERGNVPVYGSNGIVGFHDKALTSGPTVVVGRKGTIGSIHLSHCPCWTIDTTYHIQFPDLLSARYCAYALSTLRLNEMNSDSSVPGLNRNAAHDRFVRFPNRSERDKIAALLGSLDDKIDLNRQMAATLEDMARAIFNSWFVNFEPVHAKVEGRDPGLPADIASMFPDNFDDEGMPSGWDYQPLLCFADLISGGTPKTNNAAYWNGSIPWASAKDVSQSEHLFLQQTERSITEQGLEKSSTKMVPAHATVVVARGATTGRNCLFPVEMAMNQTCYALKSHEGFDYWFNLTFRNEIERIVASAHGSAFDTITTVTLQNAKVIPATESIRRAFEKLVSPLFERVLMATIESRRLRSIRDYLLPELLSGELLVADAETVIAAA